MADLELHKISETSSTITLGWTPPADAAGYRFTREKAAGKYSHTWDGARKDAKFSKDSDWYTVDALAVAAQGTYPPVTAPPEPPLSSLWDRFLQWYKTAPPTPLTPNKAANTEADARAKITGLQTGDVLRVTGVTFTRSSDGTCLDLRDLPACTIEFAGCKAVHTGRTLYPVVSCENWHRDTKVYGLDITGPQANNGIRTDDSRGLWWGFNIHDVGGTGLMTVATADWDGPYDFRGEIANAALRLDLDPHYEPGTGIHSAYIGGSNLNIYGNTGTFVIYAHDQPHGAVLNLGSRIKDATFVAWGERINFNAQSQVAGNVLQWWDNGPSLGPNIRVPFVYGKDLAGRVAETDGAGAADWPIVHEFGRGERVCLNPRLSNVAFAPKQNFVYQDCSATYA